MLLNATRNLFPNYYYVFYRRSKPGFRVTVTRGGVNQVWILKNSKDMLEYIQSRSLSSCNSIKTFDFSTLYTNIPHSKLKYKLRELVKLFHKKE